LVDDESPRCKATGCELLSIFLKITPSTLLARTGLGEVIEAAVMPALLYLPPLTPSDQSVQLLSAAYGSLYALSHIRYPEGADTKERIRFFDDMLRRGVLEGLSHVAENVHVATTLLRQVDILVQNMGTYSVKHLKVSHNTNLYDH
jgi:hypothetical protein